MPCSWSKWPTHSEHGPERCLHKPSNGCWQNHFLMFCLWLQRHLVAGEGTPKDLGYEVCLTSSILSSPSLELALATHCDLKQTILWKFDKSQNLKSSRVFWHFIAKLLSPPINSPLSKCCWGHKFKDDKSYQEILDPDPSRRRWTRLTRLIRCYKTLVEWSRCWHLPPSQPKKNPVKVCCCSHHYADAVTQVWSLTRFYSVDF